MLFRYISGIVRKLSRRKNHKRDFKSMPYDLDETDTTAIKNYLDIYATEGFYVAENFFYEKLDRRVSDKIEPLLNSIMESYRKISKNSERKVDSDFFIDTEENERLTQELVDDIFDNMD